MTKHEARTSGQLVDDLLNALRATGAHHTVLYEWTIEVTLPNFLYAWRQVTRNGRTLRLEMWYESGWRWQVRPTDPKGSLTTGRVSSNVGGPPQPAPDALNELQIAFLDEVETYAKQQAVR